MLNTVFPIPRPTWRTREWLNRNWDEISDERHSAWREWMGGINCDCLNKRKLTTTLGGLPWIYQSDRVGITFDTYNGRLVRFPRWYSNIINARPQKPLLEDGNRWRSPRKDGIAISPRLLQCFEHWFRRIECVWEVSTYHVCNIVTCEVTICASLPQRHMNSDDEPWVLYPHVKIIVLLYEQEKSISNLQKFAFCIPKRDTRESTIQPGPLVIGLHTREAINSS